MVKAIADELQIPKLRAKKIEYFVWNINQTSLAIVNEWDLDT